MGVVGVPYIPPPGTIISPGPTPKTPAKTPAKGSATSMNPTQWAELVAQDLGINVSQDPNSVQDILAWMKNEEPYQQWWGGFGTAANPGRLNPLNAGDIGKFGYSGQAGGTGTYGTLAAAAGATADMIRQQNMSPRGGGILGALTSGASIDAFTRALEASPWASSHYGGRAFSAGQAVQEAQGPAVTNRAALAGGAIPPGSSIVDALLAAGVNPDVIANQEQAAAIGQAGTLNQQEADFEKQILQANYGFSQQQLALQQQQLGLQLTELEQQGTETARQRQYQIQQDILSGEAIKNAIAGINLSEKQGLQGLASSGVYGTGSRGQFEQGIGLQRQQEQIAMGQLETAEKAQGAQYGYTQQQIQNGERNVRMEMQKLGINAAEAQNQYQNALKQLNLNNLMNINDLQQQIFSLAGGGYSPLQAIMQQLQGLIPGLSGSLGG